MQGACRGAELSVWLQLYIDDHLLLPERACGEHKRDLQLAKGGDTGLTDLHLTHHNLWSRCASRKDFMRQMNTSAYDESDDEEDGRPRGVQCAQQ